MPQKGRQAEIRENQTGLFLELHHHQATNHLRHEKHCCDGEACAALLSFLPAALIDLDIKLEQNKINEGTVRLTRNQRHKRGTSRKQPSLTELCAGC